MSKTTYTDSAHTAEIARGAADAPHASSGLPNRLMTALEVAEFIGCHEETVRGAYLNITDEELRKAMTGGWERRLQLRAVGQ